MPDTKELLETVRDYEIRIYNESRTLHLHYPISAHYSVPNNSPTS